jgi:CO dehydrogenase maturation factor
MGQRAVKNRIIGVTGKGGSGKTAIVSMMIKLLSGNNNKVLAIDGDSAGGLSYTLGVKVNQTVGDIRKGMIDDPKQRKEARDVHIRQVVSKALIEGKSFSLLAMGRAEGPGCYCNVNELLKYGIESLSKDFDVVLVDCEAGPEQISRRMLEKADLLAIVVDNSFRSIQVAGVIGKIAKDSQGKGFDRMGLIVNKYVQGEDTIVEAAKKLGLDIFGCVPEDRNISDHDLSGKPLLELPDDSPSVVAVRGLLGDMGLMNMSGKPR